MRKILLIEPELTGHHENYLYNIVLALQASACKLYVATNSCDEAFNLEARLSNFENVRFIKFREFNFYGLSSASKFGSAFDKLRLYFTIVRIFRSIHAKHEIDFVFMPYGDSVLHLCSIFGSPFDKIPWFALSMRTSFGHSNVPRNFDRLKAFSFKRVLKIDTLNGIFVIDPIFKNCAEGIFENPFARKIKYLPDPVEKIKVLDKDSSRHHLLGNASPSDCLVLVYGALSMRKGVRCLVDFILRQNHDNKIRVLLVGRCGDDFKNFLTTDDYVSLRDSGRAIEFFHRVDAEFQDLVFSAADVCWLGYENHREMSGVLMLAEAYGLPSIVSVDGLLGWFNNEYKFGLALDDVEDSTFSSKESLLAAVRRNREIFSLKRKRLMEEHSWENFSRILNIHIGSGIHVDMGIISACQDS